MISYQPAKYDDSRRARPLTGRANTTGPATEARLAGLTSLLLLGWWTLQQSQFVIAPNGGATNGGDLTLSLKATEEGSVFNSLIVAAFGALGALYLRRGAPLLGDRRVRVVVVLLCLYVVWASATVFWSVESALTIRRSIQLALVILGCGGLGLGFYGMAEDGQRKLARHAVIAGCVAMVALWGSIARYGDASLLDPSWSVKNLYFGTQGILYPLAFSAVAFVWLCQQRMLGGSRALLYAGACLISAFAIKGRFITAFSLVVVLAQTLLEPRLSFRKVLACLVVLGVGAYGLGVLAALGGQPAIGQITDTLWTYVTLDTGGGDVATLTGRTPLWDELIRSLQEQPWWGYGFGAFWNPDNMARIWKVIGWNAPAGHEGYLDEALGTGLIGLSLFLCVWLVGLVLATRARLQHIDPFATIVLAWMILFLMYNVGDSIMQSYFQVPFYASLTALFALLGQQARQARPRPNLRSAILRFDGSSPNATSKRT
ncbi:MAG: hypothetical protein M3069_16135 [Chloroflexota bacterium]|nr:hypothetical protein [Chloroflexota bacterium]